MEAVRAPATGAPPDATGAARPDAARHIILVLGARRAGKTSLVKVVFESYQPNDTLFLAPTMRSQRLEASPLSPCHIWDVPGSALMNMSARAPQAPPPVLATPGQEFAWSQVTAVIFVVDAQDDYTDALAKLNQVIVAAYTHNAAIHFHMFINKLDGLSEDYKYDTQRDIEQRVYEGLVDSSHEIQTSSHDLVQLDEQVHVQYHLTSIYDTSAFIAFSRVQQQLLQGPPPAPLPATSPALSAETPAAPAAPPKMSLLDALESACNALCVSCHFEKAYIFDVSSRTYVACDTSPFDQALFHAMFQFLQFLRQFTKLYSHMPPTESPDTCGAVPPPHWTTSVVRLNNDTSLAFWQLDSRLALMAVVHTDVYQSNVSILDANVHLFRDTLGSLLQLVRP